MATVIEQARTVRSEERFFLILAWAMALTIVGGFSINLVLGRSTFAVPAIFHIHAFVFFGWVALYLAQNTLVASGNVALHRRLGWIAMAWIPLMVTFGIAMTVVSLRRNGGPPFFDMREFATGNPIALLGFAGLAGTAIMMRRRTDWHRRLMLCAMAGLTGPGLGRLLPMPLLIPFAWWIANLATLIFPIIAVVADRRRHGRVHPALLWGIGVLLGALLLGETIAYTPAGLALTEWMVSGSPGSLRPVAAHFP